MTKKQNALHLTLITEVKINTRVRVFEINMKNATQCDVGMMEKIKKIFLNNCY